MSGSGANEAAEGLDTMEANDAAAAAAAATVEAGALATGARFMWHKCRMQDEQGRFGYEECGGQEAGAVADTRVHRFARGPRFARDDQAQLDADPEFQEALAALHSGQSGPTSHQTRVNRFALLERYTLEHAPDSEYANFLLKLEAQVGSEEEQMRAAERFPELDIAGQLSFESPPSLPLGLGFEAVLRLRRTAYGSKLRSPAGPQVQHKYNTIRCRPPPYL